MFGFSDRSAPRLLEFLRAHAASLAHLSGLGYSGELGHPFHVIDEDVVVLSLDHPFVPEGRFASLLVRDRALAESLAQGFEALWQRALRSRGEVRFLPRPRPQRRRRTVRPAAASRGTPAGPGWSSRNRARRVSAPFRLSLGRPLR